MTSMLETILYGNTLRQWGIALVAALIVLAVLEVLRPLLLRRMADLVKRTKTDIDDFAVELIRGTKLFFMIALALYIGSLFVALPENVHRIIEGLTMVAIFVQAALWGSQVISFAITRYKERPERPDAARMTTMSALGYIGKIVLWSLILLMILANLGVDITGLIAGLGIGGIAVALAVQNVLSDLLASLSIVLDKPFVIGDFIIVDDYLGTIEHIGLKTTRVRSLSGEQLVFSNGDLLGSRIRNYKRMQRRRIVFAFGVTYDTPIEKLEAIPGMIRGIIDSEERANFDRAHWKEYGDFSLNFEVVYNVKVPDYNIYMDIQQTINLAIFRKFNEEGIEFAFPTQTLYLQKGEGASQ